MVRIVQTPQRGDLIWVDFTPQAGHEQAGRRPALVLSPETYNLKTGLAIACPVTSRAKGYPFEVLLPEDLPVSGVVLSDHVRNIDWQARHADHIAQAGDDIVGEVCGKIAALIEA